jgi:hypothetical protein
MNRRSTSCLWNANTVSDSAGGDMPALYFVLVVTVMLLASGNEFSVICDVPIDALSLTLVVSGNCHVTSHK